MSGLKIKYSELFSLSVEQLFYENRICKKYKTDPLTDIRFVPTPECMQLMKRFDFVFRRVMEKGGFVVLANTFTNSTGDTVLRFPVKNDIKLSFWMLLENSALLNFNDLPVITDSAAIYYFSNQLSDAAAPRTSLHISVDSAGVDGNNDLIKRSFSDYRFHHTAMVVAGTAFIRHLLTGAQMEPRTIVNQSGESDLYFDLSSFPSGKCKLVINASDKDLFYHIGVSAASKVFGVIEISLADLLQANYRVLEPGSILTADRPVYKVQFNNRKTLWRYTIVLEKSHPIYIAMLAMTPVERTNFLDHFKIITNDSAISFTRASSTDTVFEFVSDNPIPLQEKYLSSSIANKGLCLTLKKNEGMPGEAIVRDFLPFPSGSVIDALNDPTIYSDIFLTI